MAACFIGADVSAASCIAGLPCVVELSDDPAAGPNASKNGENEACDADFMNQIYARAFIESEREVSIAAQDVVKPDSVLAYSCFHKNAKAAVSDANPMFSAKSPKAVSATGTYNSAVKSAVDSYLSNNFSSDFVGGGTGENYSASSSVCDYISTVQFLSQCGNFDTIGPQFYDFDTLASQDIRLIPTGGSCPGNAITSDLIDVANNKDGKYARRDVFEEYSEIVNGDSCSDPVETGLEYQYGEQDLSWSGVGGLLFGTQKTYQDKICVNPMCYYDPDIDRCKEKP